MTFDPDSRTPRPDIYWTSALWDTGSSDCFISRSCAENLNLGIIDKTWVENPQGRSYENVYYATLFLPSKHYIEVELTECHSLSSIFEVIIGMNVIAKGDFAITGTSGKTKFSFRLPSQSNIDFCK